MTKERLRQYRGLVLEQNNLHMRIERLRAKCEGGAIVLTDMPKGGVPLDYPVELADALRLMMRKEAEIHAEMVAVEEFISSIPDSITRTIFRMRYHDAMKWEDIADNVNYNRRYIIKKHDIYLK